MVIPLSVKREGYYEKLLTLGELFSRLPRFFLPLGPGPRRKFLGEKRSKRLVNKLFCVFFKNSSIFIWWNQKYSLPLRQLTEKLTLGKAHPIKMMIQ